MKQWSLKPQDLVVALKLATVRNRSPTIAQLAKDLSLSASEVHACIKRCGQSRLLQREEEGLRVARSNLIEFVVYGVRYAYPPILEGVTSGVPTAYAAKPLSEHLVQSAEFAPVWAHPTGSTRGASLAPLYPTAPDAALRDAALYELLALTDALRMGGSRDRSVATQLLQERLN